MRIAPIDEESDVTTLQATTYWLAVGLYTVNLGVGFAAQMRWVHFGITHHILYFFVFATAILATIFILHPLLFVTLAALSYMPVSKPGTWRHPAAAMVGYIGLFFPCL